MKKYGFVYIWYDRKHKRFYVGCRWGRENDGYICSSKWMKDSYKRRPGDFKRRILSIVDSSKKDLLDEEHKWLRMIKDEELGKRYYNLQNHHFGHWSSNPEKKKSISERMKGNTLGNHWKGKKHSEATKQKISKTKTGQPAPPHAVEWARKLGQSNKGRKAPWSAKNFKKIGCLK